MGDQNPPPDIIVNMAVEDSPPEYSPSPVSDTPSEQPDLPPPSYSQAALPYTPPPYTQEAVANPPPEYSLAAVHSPPSVHLSQVMLGVRPYYPAVPECWTCPSSEAPVIIQPQSTAAVQTDLEEKISADRHMWLGCFVYWFCNCLAGTIAIALAMASSDAILEKRSKAARTYRWASFMTSLLGILLGIATVGAIIALSRREYESKSDVLIYGAG